jgi:hypothetical protein
MNLNPIKATDFEIMLRQCVSVGGGRWCGIQEPIFPDMNPVLTFTHPETGDLSALRINPITWDEFSAAKLANQIHDMIEDGTKRKTERVVHVPVRVLKQLAAKLLKLSEEIAALYEEKQ